jgi:nucleoid DNA-binding protein
MGVVVKVRAKRLPFFKTGKELRERVGRGRAGTGAPLAA